MQKKVIEFPFNNPGDKIKKLVIIMDEIVKKKRSIWEDLTPLSEVLLPLGGGGRRREGAFKEPVEGGVGVYVTWITIGWHQGNCVTLLTKQDQLYFNFLLGWYWIYDNQCSSFLFMNFKHYGGPLWIGKWAISASGWSVFWKFLLSSFDSLLIHFMKSQL